MFSFYSYFSSSHASLSLSSSDRNEDNTCLTRPPSLVKLTTRPLNKHDSTVSGNIRALRYCATVCSVHACHDLYVVVSNVFCALLFFPCCVFLMLMWLLMQAKKLQDEANYLYSRALRDKDRASQLAEDFENGFIKHVKRMNKLENQAKHIRAKALQLRNAAAAAEAVPLGPGLSCRSISLSHLVAFLLDFVNFFDFFSCFCIFSSDARQPQFGWTDPRADREVFMRS